METASAIRQLKWGRSQWYTNAVLANLFNESIPQGGQEGQEGAARVGRASLGLGTSI